MIWNENAVREALRSLDKKGLAGAPDNLVSRVSKYEHRLQGAYNFTRHENPLFPHVFPRGPQPAGECGSPPAPTPQFDDLGIVQSTLQRLMKREPPLVKVLP